LCLKRGGKAEFVYIDLEEAEDRYGQTEIVVTDFPLFGKS